MQVSLDSALSAWSAAGGTAGLIAFGTTFYKLGRFSNRVEQLERDVGASASKETVTAMKDTLEQIQREIGQIRDILMNERRR
ncbi:MAG TPA: hypothetical protein VFF44_12295 [Casimicrobiaceae bacterium]|nr:hypothetical protein [Casimicrobiaceae bacterium]